MELFIFLFICAHLGLNEKFETRRGMGREPAGSRGHLRNNRAGLYAADIHWTGTMINDDETISEPGKPDAFDWCDLQLWRRSPPARRPAFL